MNDKIFILLFFLIVCCLINQSQSARKCRKPGKKIKTAIDSIESKIESKINTNQQQLWNPTQSLAMNQQWTNGFGQQLTGLNPIVSSIENRGNNNLLTNPFGILVNRPADSSSTSEVEVNVPVSFPNQGLSSSSIVEAIEQQFAPWKESTSSSASSSARGSSVDLQEVAAFELNKMLQKAQSAQWNLPKIQQQATFYSSSSSSSATSSSSESQVKLFSPESLSMKESSSSESSSSEASAEPEVKVTLPKSFSHKESSSPSSLKAQVNIPQFPTTKASTFSSTSSASTANNQQEQFVRELLDAMSKQQQSVSVKASESVASSKTPSSSYKTSTIPSHSASPVTSPSNPSPSISLSFSPRATLESSFDKPSSSSLVTQTKQLPSTASSVSPKVTLTTKPSPQSTLETKASPVPHSNSLTSSFQSPSASSSSETHTKQLPPIISSVSSPTTEPTQETQISVKVTKAPSESTNKPEKSKITITASPSSHIDTKPSQITERISPTPSSSEVSSPSITSRVTQIRMKRPPDGTEYKKESDYVNPNIVIPKLEFYHNVPNEGQVNDQKVNLEFSREQVSPSISVPSSTITFSYDQQQELAARALAQNLQKEQSNQWNKPNTDQQSAIYSSSSASASSTSESGVTFDSPTNWPQKELISSKSSSSASASASLEAEMDTPFGKVLKDSSSSSASAAASVGVLSYDQQQELAAQALAQNFQNKMSNQNGMGNIPNNQQPFTSYSSASSASASAKSESDVTFDSPNNWPQKELLSSKASSSAAASSSSKAESQFPFWRESVSLPESAERLSTNQAQFLAALEYSELLKKAQSTASSSAEVGLTPLIFAQKDASASSSSAVLLDKFDINQQQTPSSAISSSQDSPSSAASHSESLQSPLTLSQILKGQFASSGESQSTNNQRKQLETFGQSPFNPSRSASSPKVNVQGNQDDSSSQAAQRRSQDQKQVNLSQSESTSSSSSSSSSSSQIQSVLTADQPQAIESSKSKINSKQSEQDETLALEKKLNNQQLESSSSAEAKYRIKSAHEGQATTHHRTSQSLMNLLNALRNQLKVTNQQLTGDQTEDLIILQLRREISQSSTIEQLQRIYRIMIIQPPEIQQAIKLQMILKAVQLQQSHNEQSTAEEIDSVQRLILSLIEHDEFMEHGTGLLEEITSGVESVVSDIIG